MPLRTRAIIAFVGGVTFEIVIVQSHHKHFDIVTMQLIEKAVMARVRSDMPVVVILLFVSGVMLFDIRCDKVACIGSRFGNWLLFKVVLAFGVLGAFVNAMWAMRHGNMSVCRFKYTHRVERALMAGIVFLAKTMFYL